MIDLTKITPEQANKIEMALVLLENNVVANIEATVKLGKCEELSEKTRAIMTSNAEWWDEAYALIYGESYIRRKENSPAEAQ